MLANLNIKNFTLIDEMSIEFSSGINVLTGETGAGKSIILDAINIITGQESASSHYIRHGEEKAYLEAIFILSEHEQELLSYLAEAGIEIDNHKELIISRELSVNARTVTRINGKSIAVSQLKDIGNLLIDLHGQHEHQSLLKKDYHIKFIDALLEKDASEIKTEVAAIYDKLLNTKRQFNRLATDSKERDREIDVLEYQLNEIISSKLIPGEENDLLQIRTKVQNSEKLFNSASIAYNLLQNGEYDGGGIVDMLKTLSKTLSEASDFDEELSETQDKVDDIIAELSEVRHSLSNYSESFDFDEKEILEIEERINTINTLKRKYGNSIEEILEFADKKTEQLHSLKNYSVEIDGYEADIIELKEKLAKKVIRLSASRKNTAECIQRVIEDNLHSLGMKNACFKINIKQLPSDNGIIVNGEEVALHKDGIDDVEFYISPNKGEQLMQLTKIASGGEISRVMLSLKAVEAKGSGVPTLIFDEIDSGVGGITAESVGKKLSEVSSSAQIITVTHLTQIALYADKHFLVEKDSDEHRTISNIREINGDEVVYELARLQTGSQITDMVLLHIKEMIKKKKQL